jgi:hypothetical protein
MTVIFPPKNNYATLPEVCPFAFINPTLLGFAIWPKRISKQGQTTYEEQDGPVQACIQIQKENERQDGQ